VEIAKGVLQKLVSDGTHLSFDLSTKKVVLHDGGGETSVNPADLLILFENGWVARYERSPRSTDIASRDWAETALPPVIPD
jgi:hypothetical protein